MSAPTQNQLDTFWNGLQDTLKKAGADLNLRSPEDLFRIRIVNIQNPDIRELTADVTCSFPFSTNPDLDPATASEEELVRAMQPGKPDNAKLTEMFNAAREGRLFVNSLIESNMSQRQLITDKDGNTSVLPDSGNSTPEILMTCRNPVKPDKPKYLSVGFGTSIAAFFGNAAAKARKQEIEEMNADMRKSYEKNYREWQQVRRMNPDFRRQVANSMLSTVCYFQIPTDEESYYREIRLSDIGTKAHKRGAYNGLKDMIALSVRQNAEYITELAGTADGINPEIERHLKQVFYMKSLEHHIDTLFDSNQLTEKEMVRCAEQSVSGSDAYNRRFALVCGERFRKALGKVKWDDVKAFAENPDKAADSLFNKMAVGFREGSEPESKLHLEKAEVRKPYREAPVSAPSARL